MRADDTTRLPLYSNGKWTPLRQEPHQQSPWCRSSQRHRAGIERGGHPLSLPQRKGKAWRSITVSPAASWETASVLGLAICCCPGNGRELECIGLDSGSCDNGPTLIICCASCVVKKVADVNQLWHQEYGHWEGEVGLPVASRVVQCTGALHTVSEADPAWKAPSPAAVILLALLPFLTTPEKLHLYPIFRGATPRKRWTVQGEIEKVNAICAGLPRNWTISPDIQRLGNAFNKLDLSSAVSKNSGQTYTLNDAIAGRARESLSYRHSCIA
ncbi:uncharacterized protein MKZ38_008708 [Zalerion maritima]|uniref:Uncharacterized protein n=1 Tax=Zalerion maritima TaxID=339359 RepID=A0AAD5RU45_9PEZI|nr:uncharacterized protein MKZ38_008708 [Zalerion maritima]